MIVNVSELRDKPQINWSPGLYAWMTKLTNEEISAWESFQIAEISNRITEDKRNVTREEISAALRHEAITLERGYHLFPSTQPQ